MKTFLLLFAVLLVSAPAFAQQRFVIERDIPGARRITIAGAGHMANMETPDEVNKALGGFLNRG